MPGAAVYSGAGYWAACGCSEGCGGGGGGWPGPTAWSTYFSGPRAVRPRPVDNQPGDQEQPDQ
eukprot:9178855-Alexandrium_andersonii.AAC.1